MKAKRTSAPRGKFSSPAQISLLAGLFLFFHCSGTPPAAILPTSEIQPMEYSHLDLTRAEVISQFQQFLPANEKQNATRLGNLVMQLSEKYRFSPSLILAMIETESSFRLGAVSRKGAVGLMQLMPGTAREVASRHKLKRLQLDLTNPELNLRLGVAYLSELRRQFGNSPHYIAAYNAGPYGMKRRMKEGNYELGAFEPYVRAIHERARVLQDSSRKTRAKAFVAAT